MLHCIALGSCNRIWTAMWDVRFWEGGMDCLQVTFVLLSCRRRRNEIYSDTPIIVFFQECSLLEARVLSVQCYRLPPGTRVFCILSLHLIGSWPSGLRKLWGHMWCFRPICGHAYIQHVLIIFIFIFPFGLFWWHLQKFRWISEEKKRTNNGMENKALNEIIEPNDGKRQDNLLWASNMHIFEYDNTII